MSSRRSISQLANGKWKARYTDIDGHERSRAFDKKGDGERWLDEQLAAIATGLWVDPKAGRRLFEDYVAAWSSRQLHRASTEEQLRRVLDLHVLPVFGKRPIATIKRSDVERWVKLKTATLAPKTVGTYLTWLKTIFKAAVEDRLIAVNPTAGVVGPKAEQHQVVPLERSHVIAIAEAMPERLRAAVIFGAATGLRQGELLGLTRDRVKFLERTVRVDRQLLTVRGRTEFGPPKSNAGKRTVPVPSFALAALAEHVKRFDVQDMDLLFTTEKGNPVARNRWSDLWRFAFAKANIPIAIGGTRAGSHAMRHFYASLLIQAGLSVKVVQTHLGHATAEETLRTYAHLWPDDEDRARRAVETAFEEHLGLDIFRTGT